MTVHTAEVAVVGAGFAGLLAARELVRAGREVTIIERGRLKSHAEQLATGSHEVKGLTTLHNHEPHPDTPYPWDYTYGIGGSSLHWTGVAPRLDRSDFELRTRYGIAEDWPIPYSALDSFYEESEQLLAVAGAPGTRGGNQPPHPLSPLDRVLAPALAPLRGLPQSRATVEINGRLRCCGANVCRLCPVDARYSLLHTLEDERLLNEGGRVGVVDMTAVASLVVERGKVVALETVNAKRERGRIEAGTVVLAANGLENPGLLLRSGIDDPDVGRYLYDHGHRMLHIRTDEDLPTGRGTAPITSMSYAYADGPWRSERGAQLILPYNPGLAVGDELADAVVQGRTGSQALDDVRRRFKRTLILDTVGEDLPRGDRQVELSPAKDRLGLPLNRVRYPRDEGYVERGRQWMYEDIERRLRPLGGRIVRCEETAMGAHSLGACRMGASDGVVDTDMRHRRFENLFVTGGSCFPTYGAAHPTLTICALAMRLGRKLGQDGG